MEIGQPLGKALIQQVASATKAERRL